MELISIVIITYNRCTDVRDLLCDINMFSNKELLKDIIIVNNKSTESYFVVNEFIQQHPQLPIQLIEAPENLGVSRGRNFATQFAKGEIMLYLDDDVNLKDTETLSRIATCFNQPMYYGRPLGLVSFKVLYSYNLEIQKNAFPNKHFDKYKDKTDFPAPYYVGCAHAITRKAWDETGNYPENFFYGMEEYDFAYRLIDKGYSIKYDSSVVIIHKESPFGRTPKNEKLRMMWVNKSKVSWRYLPKKFFYSTTFMWAGEFLVKTRFNMPNFLKGCKEIFTIPGKEKRRPINKSALDYLRETDARLFY